MFDPVTEALKNCLKLAKWIPGDSKTKIKTPGRRYENELCYRCFYYLTTKHKFQSTEAATSGVL